jgi:glycerophosphoryl diester phosphodiesterase
VKVILILLLVIVLIYYGLYFVLRGPRSTNVQLIAHRGGPEHNPENTMAAFQHAIDAGADWIEFDVQRTRDDVLVIIHDKTVDRTTNGSGKVGELTLEQIRALNAGNGEQVPTFEQVIALAKSAGVGIIPEAKHTGLYPGLGEQMAAAIEAGDYVNRTALQSFDLGTLVAVQEKNPEQAVCPLFGLWQFDLSEPEPSDAKVLCPMGEMVLLNPWMIRQAHQAGRQVYVWFGVIESPLVMRIMLAMGADGLMVDDPDALAEILDR